MYHTPSGATALAVGPVACMPSRPRAPATNARALVLRGAHKLHARVMHTVPAAAGRACGVGRLHPVLDGGQEPLEAKVREGQDTLVQPDGSFGYAVYLQRERSHCEYT